MFDSGSIGWASASAIHLLEKEELLISLLPCSSKERVRLHHRRVSVFNSPQVDDAANSTYTAGAGYQGADL